MSKFSLEEYLRDLKEICGIDSGHYNGVGTAAMADFFETRYQVLGFSTQRRYVQVGEKKNDFAPVLLITNAEPDASVDVMFLAHMDTVFPVGTAAEWQLTVDENGIGSAPGCVDCKGGCLLLYYLLRRMQEEGTLNFTFCAVMNSDEEKQSIYSRGLIEEIAQRAEYCFVMEPGRQNHEYVGRRKGGLNYLIKCHGISAHSGVEPEKGASAILELSKWVSEIYALVDYEKGTTVNIGRFNGGGDNGAVPDYAECTLSYRFLENEAISKLEALFERMKSPFDPRTSLEAVQVSRRPAMEPHEKTQVLLKKLQEAGNQTGTSTEWIVTGGGSDGNFVAHYGTAVLDGCGPCGGKLHTRDEYIETETVEQRLDTLTCLLGLLFP